MLNETNPHDGGAMMNGYSRTDGVDHNFQSVSLKKEIRTIQLGEINMEYLLTGNENSETIIFVHGLGANLSQFENQHAYFQDRYKVLSVSLRGHGNTSSPDKTTESDFVLSRLGDDIINLLDALEIRKVHYVGNSMGGNIGYELMRAHPDRMLSFTSYGTTAKLEKSKLTIELMKLTYKLMSIETIGRLSSSAGMSEYSKAKIVEMMSQVRKSTILSLIPHLGKFDYLDVIRDSQVTAQIIRGDKDKEINKEIGSTIETFRRRGDFILTDLAGSGHFANLDDPDLFNRALETFLTRLKRPGRS